MPVARLRLHIFIWLPPITNPDRYIDLLTPLTRRLTPLTSVLSRRRSGVVSSGVSAVVQTVPPPPLLSGVPLPPTLPTCSDPVTVPDEGEGEGDGCGLSAPPP